MVVFNQDFTLWKKAIFFSRKCNIVTNDVIFRRYIYTQSFIKHFYYMTLSNSYNKTPFVLELLYFIYLH